jgi:hypothetical protein
VYLCKELQERHPRERIHKKEHTNGGKIRKKTRQPRGWKWKIAELRLLYYTLTFSKDSFSGEQSKAEAFSKAFLPLDEDRRLPKHTYHSSNYPTLEWN